MSNVSKQVLELAEFLVTRHWDRARNLIRKQQAIQDIAQALAAMEAKGAASGQVVTLGGPQMKPIEDDL